MRLEDENEYEGECNGTWVRDEKLINVMDNSVGAQYVFGCDNCFAIKSHIISFAAHLQHRALKCLHWSSCYNGLSTVHGLQDVIIQQICKIKKMDTTLNIRLKCEQIIDFSNKVKPSYVLIMHCLWLSPGNSQHNLKFSLIHVFYLSHTIQNDNSYFYNSI